jgi:hypothetical protein
MAIVISQHFLYIIYVFIWAVFLVLYTGFKI